MHNYLEIFTTVFTGMLAVIGWCQYYKTTQLANKSIFSQQTLQLTEVMAGKAKDCNNFFPYGKPEKDDEIRIMHCFNEIVISITTLDHLINYSFKELGSKKEDFKKIFWYNLNTRIREAIEKNGYGTLTVQDLPEEYLQGHKINAGTIRQYFRDCISKI